MAQSSNIATQLVSAEPVFAPLVNLHGPIQSIDPTRMSHILFVSYTFLQAATPESRAQFVDAFKKELMDGVMGDQLDDGSIVEVYPMQGRTASSVYLHWLPVSDDAPSQPDRNLFVPTTDIFYLPITWPYNDKFVVPMTDVLLTRAVQNANNPALTSGFINRVSGRVQRVIQSGTIGGPIRRIAQQTAPH
jgi:hypothetical protein